MTLLYDSLKLNYGTSKYKVINIFIYMVLQTTYSNAKLHLGPVSQTKPGLGLQ